MREMEDIPLSLADFRTAKVNDISASAEKDIPLVALQSAFAKASREALENASKEVHQILELMAEVLFLKFAPENRSMPFAYSAFRPNGEATVLDMFTDRDFAFFEVILPEIESPLLRSRIADLVWLKKRSGAEMGLQALDAYSSVSLEPRAWFNTTKACYTRAIDLAIMLKTAAGDRLEEIKTALFAAFQASDTSDAFFGGSLAEFIIEKGLADAAETDILVSHLDTLAHEFQVQNDCHAVRIYREAARKCYIYKDDKLKAAEMRSLEAEAWVVEAEARMVGEDRSFTAAASCFENAVKLLMGIPRREREALNLNDKIVELRGKMAEMSSRAPEEMQRFSTPINLDNMIARATRAVKGKPLNEALYEFSNLWAPPSKEYLQKEALEILQVSLIRAVSTQMSYTDDGRLVATCPGLAFADTEEEFLQKNTALIRSQMVEVYRHRIQIAVAGYIIPALNILHEEHAPDKSVFISLAHQSPIVPPGRSVVFGSGLYAGYERDFVSAIHLLVPQVENLVRFQMKNAGEITTSPQKGVWQEVGLSNLMDRESIAEKIFGADFAFEINALFCNPFGANLRNEVAHGLVTEYGLQSADVVYAWWLCLSMAFKTFWNKAATNAAANAALLREAEEAICCPPNTQPDGDAEVVGLTMNNDLGSHNR